MRKRQLEHRRSKVRSNDIVTSWMIVLFYALVFQNPLESVHKVFCYIDEAVPLFVVVVMAVLLDKNRGIVVQKYIFLEAIPLVVFVFVGLLGNVLWHYQPFKVVAVDLIANLKFFFSLAVGYLFLPKCINRKGKRRIIMHLYAMSAVMLGAFLIERFYPVWGQTEVRYGIRSAKMFFSHSTYLAGALAFLTAALIMFFHKKNLFFIATNLIIMAFTLRSKAIASAAAFVAIYVFFVVMKKELKLWHVFVAGAAVLAIGWKQIMFYFVEVGDTSARSIMTATSFKILGDYFPIGTGFGTFASSAAADHYSPVYVNYGFEAYGELMNLEQNRFFNDTFWPIIIGQTGFIGTVAYLVLLYFVFSKVFQMRDINKYWYVAGISLMVYCLISSTSEPILNNSISISFAVLLGGIIRVLEICRKVDNYFVWKLPKKRRKQKRVLQRRIDRHG